MNDVKFIVMVFFLVIWSFYTYKQIKDMCEFRKHMMQLDYEARLLRKKHDDEIESLLKEHREKKQGQEKTDE